MLERILREAYTAHKYSVGLVDEGIHRGIDILIDPLSRRGYRQAAGHLLCALSGIGTFSYVTVQSLSEQWRLLGDHSGPSTLAKINADLRIAGQYLLTRTLELFDRYLFQSKPQHGVIVHNPLDDMARAVRPYALAATGYAACRLLGDDSGELERYGALMLPWALSLYVKDTEGPGIWSEVRDNLKRLGKRAAQAPAA